MSSKRKQFAYSVADVHEDLRNGDCMSQPEFHRIYSLLPTSFRAELIDGTVFVSEPVSFSHGDNHAHLVSLLYAFRGRTPGLQSGCDTTVVLGEKDEVQPDVILRILPEYEGQSKNTEKGNYIQGGPELAAEVAYSSKAIDLHAKKRRYALARVREYIVLCLRPLELHWYDLRQDCRMLPDSEGIIRSNVFPGLWINQTALLQNNYELTMATLNQGLASDKYIEFVEKLTKARQIY